MSDRSARQFSEQAEREEEAILAPIRRREEFDNAIREYGAEAASALKLAYLDTTGEQFDEGTAAKARAFQRVREAWRAMVENRDPETIR